MRENPLLKQTGMQSVVFALAVVLQALSLGSGEDLAEYLLRLQSAGQEHDSGLFRLDGVKVSGRGEIESTLNACIPMQTFL